MSSIRDQIQPGEEIVYHAHPTRLTLLPLAILAIVIAITAIVIYFQTGILGVLLVGLAIALIAGVQILARWIVLRSNEYVLTNRRVIKQTGIITKSSTDAYLEKINNVEHRQTLWGRLLGYGDLEIDTASETGTTCFAMLSNPLEFKQKILATKEQSRGGVLPVAPSGAERIRQLKTLLDDGLISAEEYEAKRKKLVDSL
ncbi:MAG TPA: PH domain-containing protein [Thermoanaerobaculia bacterium]